MDGITESIVEKSALAWFESKGTSLYSGPVRSGVRQKPLLWDDSDNAELLIVS